jgi:hypothetical protein
MLLWSLRRFAVGLLLISAARLFQGMISVFDPHPANGCFKMKEERGIRRSISIV